MTDDLLPLIAAGDSDAVKACVSRYGNLIWAIALRLSPTRADAEDAVQDVFLDLWRFADRFDAKRGSEKVFVSMMARRRLIDRHRARRARPAERPVDLDLSVMANRDHERLEACSEARAAVAAIDELPEDRREVVRLAVHLGYTHSQIAKKTGIPLGTVKSHVRRGLLAVRARLTEPMGEGLRVTA